MVHCNNCTSDLDAWVGLFAEVLQSLHAPYTKPALYDAVYEAALQAEPDAGGLVSFNYYSGEPITALNEGRPLLARQPDSRLNLPNFARNLIFSALATLKIGMDILTQEEHVRLKHMTGHGGLFKTPVVGQRLMAAALQVPVEVMASAGEGGPWGMALLAAYHKNRRANESLEDYLQKKVFAQSAARRETPQEEDVQGFAAYMRRYKAALPVQACAVKHLR